MVRCFFRKLPFKIIWKNYQKLPEILATSMTTVEAERCFSTLKDINFFSKLNESGSLNCCGNGIDEEAVYLK